VLTHYRLLFFVTVVLNTMGCNSNGVMNHPSIDSISNADADMATNTSASMDSDLHLGTNASSTTSSQSESEPFIVAAEAETVAQPDIGAAAENIEAQTTPVDCDASSERLQTVFIELINTARAQPRQCGDTSHNAAPPLSWSSKLAEAAQRHSTDMVSENFFSHTGSDLSSVANRVEAAQYEWQSVGENLAAGQQSLHEAIDGWLDSPGHCRNIMNTSYIDAGLACDSSESTEFRTYWTNVFGAEFE